MTASSRLATTATALCDDRGISATGEVAKADRVTTGDGPDRAPTEIRRLPHEVVATFVEHAQEFLTLGPVRQSILAVVAGSFITVGAMLSIALSDGVTGGLGKLLLGLGFASGFSMVIISGAALFTEINVLLPDLALQRRSQNRKRSTGRLSTSELPGHLGRFWILVIVGNAAGAFLVAAMLVAADAIGPEYGQQLAHITAEKMRFREMGVAGWFGAVISGVLGNWLVGMAAFLAAAARTVSSKIIGVIFPILTFVALGLQHTPANFGYFSLASLNGDLDASWSNVIAWNLAPAAIGNIAGGAILVGALFWYTSAPERSPPLSTGSGSPDNQ